LPKVLAHRTALLYSCANLGSEALAQSRYVWLVYFYAPPADADRAALLKLSVVSALLFAGKLLEAFDDALIGHLSDRTRSRWGRRIPFVLAAAPFWALFAVLAFTPPEHAGTTAMAVYFFIMLELFYLFDTLVSVPYEALLPELARGSPERVRLSMLAVYFGMAGAVVGLVGSGLLIDLFGFRVMTVVLALLALTTRYIGLAGVWREASQSRPTGNLSLRASLRASFASRHFLLFLPSFVLFQAGLTMLLIALPYYVNAVLAKDDEGVWVALLSAVAIGAMVLSMPIFARLARRTSKRHAFATAMLVAGATFPLLFVAGYLPGPPKLAQVLVAMALCGAPLAGVFLFPAPLIADIVDDDARRTGLRREGTYYGAQNVVEKSVAAIAPGLLALVLLLGNSAADPLGVRLVGPVAGLLVLGGYVIFRRFDLPDEVDLAISSQPSERSGSVATRGD
jgi:GPH family glycoside/pentoside/hexuronide:cation symporter